MKKFFKPIRYSVACASLACVMTTACSDSKDNKNVVVDTKALQQSGKTLNESAENLALAGEQLISPVSFMYADLVFELALKANPENKRAQFFKVLLKPMMSIKGALSRIKPVVKTLTPEQQKEYNDFIQKAPNSALKTFLLDGPEDILNEEDALNFMDGYRASWEEIRQFMKDNKDLNLDINIMTMEGTAAALEKASEACKTTSNDGVITVNADCSYLNALKVNISRADVEAIQQIAAGMQIYHTLATSYSLDGVRQFAEKNKDNKLSAKQVINHFSKSTNAGKLRNNGLAQIPQLGLDAISGTRWALSAQDQLCKSGAVNSENRKGFLFEQGLCINKTDSKGKPVEDVLKTVEAVLIGGLMTIDNQSSDRQSVTADIKPVAPLSNPMSDLRSLTPTSYNKCGNPVALADSSIGGLFPNKDGNSYLKKVGSLDDQNCD